MSHVSLPGNIRGKLKMIVWSSGRSHKAKRQGQVFAHADEYHSVVFFIKLSTIYSL